MNMFNKNKNINYDCKDVDDLVSLNKKIYHFYSWLNLRTDYDVEVVKSLIEKIVLWYEFRYSNNYFDFLDVDKFLIGDLGSNCNKSTWCNMFDYDKFLHKDMTGNCDNLEWCNLFNYDKFYYMLSDKEKKLLDKPKFPNIIDLYPGSRNHFHVDDNGIINDGEDVWIRRKRPGDVMNCDIFFRGQSLKDVEKINIENNLGLNIESVKKVVSNVLYKESIRDGILDTIMYRIIENGGKYYGPRRAYLFAKEFDRNTDLPISYGDSGLIGEYLEHGGNGELICYPKYFDGVEKEEITASELLSCQNLVDNSNKIKRKIFK